jgi:hypothetical protein
MVALSHPGRHIIGTFGQRISLIRNAHHVRVVHMIRNVHYAPLVDAICQGSYWRPSSEQVQLPVTLKHSHGGLADHTHGHGSDVMLNGCDLRKVDTATTIEWFSIC